MENINYVFDVDGTLTPSRLPMDLNFQSFFLKWMESKNVYLLTGSDYLKTIEQVGRKVWESVTESHQCGGNVVYRKGELVYSSSWTPSKDLLDLCQNLIDKSIYPIKRGNHLETRVGLLNISVVGRACSQSQRLDYFDWDQNSQERAFICEEIHKAFPNLEASAGGQISIDIHEKEKNKSQIIDKLNGLIYFVGDKTMEGGNDFPIAKALSSPNKVFQVSDWSETLKLLSTELK